MPNDKSLLQSGHLAIGLVNSVPTFAQFKETKDEARVAGARWLEIANHGDGHAEAFVVEAEPLEPATTIPTDKSVHN